MIKKMDVLKALPYLQPNQLTEIEIRENGVDRSLVLRLPDGTNFIGDLNATDFHLKKMQCKSMANKISTGQGHFTAVRKLCRSIFNCCTDPSHSFLLSQSSLYRQIHSCTISHIKSSKSDEEEA